MNKLIKISECHYIIVSDEKIAEGDYYWDSLVSHWEGVGILQMIGYAGETIIQSSAGTTSPISTSMKVTHSTESIECDALDGPTYIHIEPLYLGDCLIIENGYDIEELSQQLFGTLDNDIGAERRLIFQAGFRKALEILGDKKYDDNDLLSFESFVSKWFDNPKASFDDYTKTMPQILDKWKSTQLITEWMVELVDGKLKLT